MDHLSSCKAACMQVPQKFLQDYVIMEGLVSPAQVPTSTLDADTKV